MKAPLEYCVQALQNKKVDKFQCVLENNDQHEMNLEGTEFSLIRTTHNEKLNITVINDNRKGNISLNRLEEKAIDEAIETVLELADTSPQDEDFDIAPYQKAAQLARGPKEPDTKRMYDLLKEYSQQVPALFPAIKLMESTFFHKNTRRHLVNSNGVNFNTAQGAYNFTSVFSSRRGDKATSFNYSGFAMEDLESSLLERSTLKDLLRQSVEHLEAKPFTDKFVGDIILAPDCLYVLLFYYAWLFLQDGPLIEGTSPLKDKLGQKVANESMTLSAEPLSPYMADGYFITDDGFKAENATIIEKGVLQSFLLSQYGARKTGLERAKNQGSCWVLEPGNRNFEQMVSQVEKGLLVVRFSGGNPGPNGDISGVAKNSYYIEDGKIKYPVTETMIAGNLIDLFNNIKAISQERINFGTGLIPYMLTSGVTIAGK